MAAIPVIHIPIYHTSLIGRGTDVAALTTHLYDPATRLLTLVGFSGSGKTRLALEVATTVAPAFPDGVVFVALAPVQDTRFVIPTIAQALDIGEDGDTPLLTTLGQSLAPRHMLLLLDNIEQVLECAADLATLLIAAPRLTLMVTSQLPLGLPAETIYSLPPLAVPADTASRIPAALLEYPAIALFVERLQAVQPRFQLTPANADGVVAICQRLEGFPLALELVAAHSAALDPRDLLLLLERHLAIPSQSTAASSSSRTAILHPVLDWCISRLPAVGKTLLLRLGVFWGGWTTAAAQAVLTPEEDLETVAEALALLVQKHLVQVETLPGQQARYVVLDAIHDYSRERLRRQRRDGPLRIRHAAYYADLAQQASAATTSTDLAHWMPWFREEIHNLRAALQCFLDQPDPTPVLQMSHHLVVFWHKHGWYTEACGWLEPALARAPDAPIIDRAWAWNLVGRFSIFVGRFAHAQATLEESGRLFQQAGDLSGYGVALGNLALLFHTQGRLTEAQGLYEQCLVLPRQYTPPDERRISTILNNLGVLYMDQGDAAAARRFYEESLVMRRRIDDPNFLTSINNLAHLAMLQGDLVTAQALFDEGIPLAERASDTINLTLMQRNCGVLALERGDAAAAITQLRLVLETYQAMNNLAEQIDALEVLGYIALVEHNWPEATAWLHQSHTLSAALGPNEYNAELVLQRSRLAMGQGDDAAAWALLQEALQLVFAEGMSVLQPEVAEQAALLMLRQNHIDQAISLWHTAAASRHRAGLPQLPSLLRWYGDQTAALVTGSTDIPPADPADLSTHLAALVPSAQA